MFPASLRMAQFALSLLLLSSTLMHQRAGAFAWTSLQVGSTKEPPISKMQSEEPDLQSGERFMVLDGIEELIASPPSKRYGKTAFVPAPAKIHLGAVLPLDLRNF